MECPLCGIDNHPSTQRCHCGHVFQKRKRELEAKDSVSEKSSSKPGASNSLDQSRTSYTTLEVGLATLLSIATYTILWIVPVVAGLFLRISISAAGTIISQFLTSKLQIPWLKKLVQDLSIAVAVGVLNQLISMTGVTLISVDTRIVLCILAGGVVTGVLRRNNFAPALKRSLIKYSLLVLVTLLTPVFSLYLLAMYSARLDIPVERLYPQKGVLEGWVLEEHPGLLSSYVRLKKGRSEVDIKVDHYGDDPPTTKEDFQEAFTGLALKGMELVGATTITEIGEETIDLDGRTWHIWLYDYGGNTLVFHFGYCEALQTNLHGMGATKDAPAVEYIREVKELISSVNCVP